MISLYSWPAHPVASMTASLLQAYVQTGDVMFLEPLMKMADLRRAHLAGGNRDGEPGTVAWAAHRLPAIINDALAKWRQLTGETRHDDLLLTDAGGYVRFIISGDDRALTRALGATANTLSVNWPMFTSEVRYTDRVLSFPHAWPRTVATGLQRVDAALLYSTVTGDPGNVENFPLNGARWHTLPRDLAVRVPENRRDRFVAELHHFGETPRAMAVSLLTLEPGRYAWQLTKETHEFARGEIALTSGNRRLSFSLPNHANCRLTLTQIR
jgi:hypothetical protein